MPRLLPLLTILSVLAGVAPASLLAQGAPLTAEIRGGVSVPVAAFSDGSGVGEGTSAGPVFGVELALGSSGWRTLYAGFSQARFGCDDAGCPGGEDYVATGVNAGVRVTLARGPVIPWIGLGGMTLRVESPGVDGSPRGVSSLGYGGEVGAGLFVRAGRFLALTPIVRYSQATTDLPGGVGLTVRAVVADLGVTLVF